MKLFIAAYFVYFFLGTTMLWAHGTHGSVVKSDGYLVAAEYDGGEPMNYAEVKITSPNAEIPFQTGRTDMLGHFLFKPHNPGSWEIEVLDGMGHRLALELIVDTEDETDNNETNINLSAGRNKTPGNVVIGLSLIFGLSGTIYGWRARRFNKNTQKEDSG